MSTGGRPDEIQIKSHNGLGIVYAEKEIREDEHVRPTRKNLMNHQKVIEKVMESYTILPFSFGTIVEGDSALKSLIDERSDEFNKSLQDIDGKVELSLKLMWEDMQPIFEEIMAEDVGIREKRDQLSGAGFHDQNEKITLGQMIEQALNAKKEQLRQHVMDLLAPHVVSLKVQKDITESMFVNLAILVNKHQESEVDQVVNDLSEKWQQNITFKYVGPTAPYNFI